MSKVQVETTIQGQTVRTNEPFEETVAYSLKNGWQPLYTGQTPVGGIFVGQRGEETIIHSEVKSWQKKT